MPAPCRVQPVVSSRPRHFPLQTPTERARQREARPLPAPDHPPKSALGPRPPTPSSAALAGPPGGRLATKFAGEVRSGREYDREPDQGGLAGVGVGARRGGAREPAQDRLEAQRGPVGPDRGRWGGTRRLGRDLAGSDRDAALNRAADTADRDGCTAGHTGGRRGRVIPPCPVRGSREREAQAPRRPDLRSQLPGGCAGRPHVRASLHAGRM